ncbi:PREDICTED: translation initiation factor IF-2-like [Priapulus caudatus]|uniref:Translation initiation factor IF-2-like n=1 Tax=Priapulus caudatus TaxID=37621 RepID=A0ABM1EC52_PRICU|nr:PREDICTED: translation initiation factor IF-2-like [Priapulus caudatus]
MAWASKVLAEGGGPAGEEEAVAVPRRGGLAALLAPAVYSAINGTAVPIPGETAGEEAVEKMAASTPEGAACPSPPADDHHGMPPSSPPQPAGEGEMTATSAAPAKAEEGRQEQRRERRRRQAAQDAAAASAAEEARLTEGRRRKALKARYRRERARARVTTREAAAAALPSSTPPDPSPARALPAAVSAPPARASASAIPPAVRTSAAGHADTAATRWGPGGRPGRHLFEGAALQAGAGPHGSGPRPGSPSLWGPPVGSSSGPPVGSSSGPPVDLRLPRRRSVPASGEHSPSHNDGARPDRRALDGTAMVGRRLRHGRRPGGGRRVGGAAQIPDGSHPKRRVISVGHSRPLLPPVVAPLVMGPLPEVPRQPMLDPRRTPEVAPADRAQHYRPTTRMQLRVMGTCVQRGAVAGQAPSPAMTIRPAAPIATAIRGGGPDDDPTGGPHSDGDPGGGPDDDPTGGPHSDGDPGDGPDDDPTGGSPESPRSSSDGGSSLGDDLIIP